MSGFGMSGGPDAPTPEANPTLDKLANRIIVAPGVDPKYHFLEILALFSDTQALMADFESRIDALENPE